MSAEGGGRKRERPQKGTSWEKGREESSGGAKPKKKFFRMRAHTNPLVSKQYPCPPTPENYEWEKMYPIMKDEEFASSLPAGSGLPQVEVLDLGCGFGGLLHNMAPILEPGVLACGLEIRGQVADFVRLSIINARKEKLPNAEQLGVIRTNSMMLLPKFISKGQCRRIFICFPDPHFKPSLHRRRIVSPALLDEYAYFLRPGGRLYTITDVEDVHVWMRDHGDEHPTFRRVPDELLVDDVWIPCMKNTAEGKKSEREGRKHHIAVFERIPDDEADARAATLPFFNGYYGGVAARRDTHPSMAPKI